MTGQYLKIWNLRVQKISKYWENHQMKFLAMHITNKKLSFDIFTVQNIFMEHDLNIIKNFGIKEKFIILSHTMYCCLLLQIYLCCLWLRLCSHMFRRTIYDWYSILLQVLNMDHKWPKLASFERWSKYLWNIDSVVLQFCAWSALFEPVSWLIHWTLELRSRWMLSACNDVMALTSTSLRLALLTLPGSLKWNVWPAELKWQRRLVFLAAQASESIYFSAINPYRDCWLASVNNLRSLSH